MTDEYGAPAGGGAGVPGAVAALGPFFAFAVHDADAPPAGAWRPVTGPGGRLPLLDERLAAVAERLAHGAGGPVPVRVAASVAHLGLAARLVSPLLALTALHGTPPRLALADLRRQPGPDGLFPLSLPDRVLAPPAPAAAPGAVLDGPLRELLEHTVLRPVSRRILWGNTASAINGASAAAAHSRSPLAPGVRRAAAVLLAHPLLAGSHTAGPRFRRTTCCLIYRAAGPAPLPPALCGDCVLAR